MFYRVILWIALRRYDFIMQADSPKDIPDVLKKDSIFEKPDDIPFVFEEIVELSAAQVDELLPYGTPITSFQDWVSFRDGEGRQRCKKTKRNRRGV
jgi:hypothetical protein